MMTSERAQVRLDTWLWRARFFKSRTLAGAHVRGEGVRLSHLGQTRRIDKPGAPVTVGDVVTFTKGSNIFTLEVLDLGSRRGPPGEARNLYRSLEGGA